MEISPICFTGVSARRKMMTPTKLKQHAKRINLAKILQTKQNRQQNAPVRYASPFYRQAYI